MAPLALTSPKVFMRFKSTNSFCNAEKKCSEEKSKNGLNLEMSPVRNFLDNKEPRSFISNSIFHVLNEGVTILSTISSVISENDLPDIGITLPSASYPLNPSNLSNNS